MRVLGILGVAILLLACTSIATAPAKVVSSPASETGSPTASVVGAHVQRQSPAVYAHAGAPTFVDSERVSKILVEVEQLRPDFENQLGELAAPGFAWGLVVDDKLVVSGVAGKTQLEGGALIAPNTVFRIGSITKVFTALAALQLQEAGKLNIHSPAERWLPELSKVEYPSSDSPLVTPLHLMTHSSGLPRLGDWNYSAPGAKITATNILEGLSKRLKFAPGDRVAYSNQGVALLGLIVSRASGQAYRDYVSKKILEPLGMTSSGWDAGDFSHQQLARPHRAAENGSLALVPEWTLGAGEGMGGLYSSVEEMARFIAFELGAWPASSAPEIEVLSRAHLRESQRTHRVRRLSVRSNSGDQFPKARLRGKGLGWSTSQTCRFAHIAWHNGGTEGHSSILALLPNRGVGVVILANGKSLNVDKVAFELLQNLHDAGVLPERQAPAILDNSLRQKIDSLLAMQAPLNVVRHEELFAESTRKYLTVDELNAMLNQLRTQHGQCRAGAAFQTYHPIWQSAALECEKGSPDIFIESAMREGQLLGFSLKSKERALERQTEHRARLHRVACQVEASSTAAK